MAILTPEQVTAIQALKTSLDSTATLNKACNDLDLRVGWSVAQQADGAYVVDRFDVLVKVDPSEYA